MKAEKVDPLELLETALVFAPGSARAHLDGGIRLEYFRISGWKPVSKMSGLAGTLGPASWNLTHPSRLMRHHILNKSSKAAAEARPSLMVEPGLSFQST